MASLLIHNAQIWTATGVNARSMLIRAGRVAELDGAASTADRMLDAGGCTVVPGLIDAHVHLIMAGKSLSQLDLSSVTSREAFEAAIARGHAELGPDQWLIAHGWSAENWGGMSPDRTWLASAGDRPVVCYRMDLHVALVNDAVLSLCDLSHDPPGGRIERDQAGRPTGIMVEAAAWQLVNPLVPDPDAAGKQACVRAAQRHAHQVGITAVGSMEYARDVADVLVPMRDELTLRCRITLLDRDWPMDFSGASLAPPDDPALGVIGCKTFIDGTLGSRTARMLEPYSDQPGQRGMLVELAEQGVLRQWALAVAAEGLSPSVHAIGDEAVRLALDAIDGIDPKLRPRIEHAQQIAASDIARFRGVIASMQPLHRADDGRFALARVGPQRIAGSFAFASLLKAGALLAFGSDWPVVSCDPMAGIRAAVTGLTLDGEPFQVQENISIEQALHGYTTGAAHALQLDDAGRLERGCLGDATILDRDPFSCDWVNDPPRVVATIVNGEVVYDAMIHRGDGQ